MQRGGKGPRQKGNRFERQMVKAFSEWWGSSFRRVPRSGGFDKNVISGDIFVVNPEERRVFPFSIECKNEECWDFPQLFEGTGPILKWYKKAAEDCKALALQPLLVFTKNYTPVFVVIDYRHMFEALHNDLFLPYRRRDCVCPNKMIVPPLWMVTLDDFFTWLRPNAEYKRQIHKDAPQRAGGDSRGCSGS